MHFTTIILTALSAASLVVASPTKIVARGNDLNCNGEADSTYNSCLSTVKGGGTFVFGDVKDITTIAGWYVN